jgi:hypothetical protein
VRRVTGLPVVAELPARAVRRRRRLALTPDAAVFADTVRAFGHGSVPPLLLLVPADGRAARSATRYVLARGLAAIGGTPVVVEADRVLVPPPSVRVPGGVAGLSELLAHDTADVVRTGAVDGIDVVPTGDAAAAPTGLRLPGRVTRAVERLREQHSTVVIQASEDSVPLPAGAVANASPVALVTVSRGATQRGLRDVIVRLRIAGIVPVGVVLLDTPRSRPADLRETWRPDEAARPTADSSGIDTGEFERMIVGVAARETR